jgi:hypothetical protein
VSPFFDDSAASLEKKGERGATQKQNFNEFDVE